MNFATVHLFRGSDLKNYNTDQVPTKEQIDNSYQGFTTKLRRGDILENVDDSGYRSEGVYMWNGTDIIRQNTEYDDYGSPAKEFKVITQFPPNYWERPYSSRYVDNSYVPDVRDSKFYWHSYNPPLIIDLTEFKVIKASQKYWILFDKMDQRHYHVLWLDGVVDNFVDDTINKNFYVWNVDYRGFPSDVTKDIVGDRIPLYAVSNIFQG